ncbi:MAG: fdnI [Pseudonocardiales bacterium]|nr:fdnI [Pseudonocardiales bacterium]
MAVGTRPAKRVDLARFTLGERIVHWLTALLTVICMATAAVLYIGSLSIAFGHRQIVETIHIYCGYALPIPMLAGLAMRAYRVDARRLNRFSPDDWRWLRSRSRRDGHIPVGKFNAGQKLNSAFTAAAILILLGTGILMHFTGLADVAYRTGATFVHDWVALALGIVVLGHISYAARDAESRRGMRTGVVDATWARYEHGAWAAEHADGEAHDQHAPAPAGSDGREPASDPGGPVEPARVRPQL